MTDVQRHLARHFGSSCSSISGVAMFKPELVLGGFFWTIVVLVIALGISWRYLGSYMAAGLEGRVHFLAWARTPCLQSARHRSRAGADLEALCGVFSSSSLPVSILITYVILRVQGHLFLNPQHQVSVGPALSWNTAASFVTNTNWQNYGGESTMSYFSQWAP